ncbi:MAG: hypothetical protein FRX49_13080 [Trebouxia sp. A1-2]|nr:MAG: hypothetical protein FRX49_13080 [Trebouxia sp. A1-2]
MIDALGGKGQTPQRAWWDDQKELWAAVHTPQELDAELKGNGKELVVIFTELGALAVQKCTLKFAVWLLIQCFARNVILLRRGINHAFFQVCVDSLKDRMKADGVRSLPYVAFYHPIEGKMLGYVNLPSRSRLLRSNIDKMLGNSGAKFALDPNGFVIVTEAAQSRALNTEEEMEEMEKEREELFSASNVPVFSTMLNWMQKSNKPSHKRDEGTYQLLVEAACEAHPHGHGRAPQGILGSLQGPLTPAGPSRSQAH